MKKLFTLFAVVLVALTLVGCTTKTYEIGLITDHGPVNDRSFNQGAWEGVESYGKEHDITYKYYRPTENSGAARLEAIRLAVRGGAKVVVAPGSSFDVPVHTAQSEFPDVKFIVLDTEPKSSTGEVLTKENTIALYYAEEQSGFLLGYAAVQDGFRKLGYVGGLGVPAVIRFGSGFIQGAEYAAKELGLDDNAVEVHYKHLDGFVAKPENKALADDWYDNKGVELIFNAGGGSIDNVIASAEEREGKFLMGANVDQRDLSKKIISSGLKQLKESVYNVLTDIYADKFDGGKAVRLTAANDGVGITPDFTRFRTFTETKYNEVYKKLADNEITVNQKHDIYNTDFKELELKKVKVEIHK